jgi:hypothetical protein
VMALLTAVESGGGGRLKMVALGGQVSGNE